jgi:hypothetical protein
MVSHPIEDRFPLLERQEMVDRVVDAQDDVEGLPQVEPSHVGPEQPRPRQLLRRELEHPLGEIHPGKFVARLELFHHRSGPAGKLEHGCCPRVVPLDQRAEVGDLLGAVSLHRVVERREDVVRRHRLSSMSRIEHTRWTTPPLTDAISRRPPALVQEPQREIC